MFERMKDLEVGNAEIIFRNFSGRKTDYNAEGMRNFSVVIPSLEQAIALYNAGWNVQIRAKEAETRDLMKKTAATFDQRVAFLQERGEIDDAIFHIKVNVSYKYEDKAPKIYIYRSSSKKREMMYETNVGTLDKAEITNIDLVIEPNYWNKGGRSGYQAFLKEAHVLIHESSFAEKYKDYYDEEDTE